MTGVCSALAIFFHRQLGQRAVYGGCRGQRDIEVGIVLILYKLALFTNVLFVVCY